MFRPMLVSAVATGVLLGMAGCKHKCCRSDGAPPRPFLPSGPGSTIPPAGVPITPGVLPPADLRPSTSGRPAPEILLPDPIGPSGASSQSKASGILGGPVKGPMGATLEPPIAVKAASTTTSVAGIAGFTKVSDGVATGHKPTLDGFDALKKDGYRTVVYLHSAGADLSAVRELAEARGLAFVAIETTLEKFADAVEKVSKATAEKAARPAFVFDDDGSRAGAVWYVHFKTVDLESAEVSKIRARALGLTDDSDFWPAIKQYLAK